MVGECVMGCLDYNDYNIHHIIYIWMIFDPVIKTDGPTSRTLVVDF